MALIVVVGFEPATLSRRARADGDWIDFRQSGRFSIRSEIPIDRFQAIRSCLTSLKDHESDIIATLRLSRSAQPVLIYLLANRRSFQTEVGRVAPEAVRRKAVFIRGDENTDTPGRVYVYLHSGTVTDLRHEVTHAILHSTLPFLPLWMDEGLAEYFEAPQAERASGHVHQRSVKLSARLPLGRVSSLERLEQKQKLSAVSERDYRDAWAWTHFLLHGPENNQRLLTLYLQSIEAHTPPGPFSKQLQRVDPKAATRLTSHFKSWK